MLKISLWIFWLQSDIVMSPEPG